MFFEQPLEELTGRPAEAPFQGRLLLHHDRAALAHHAQRGGHLAADVGAADQHHLFGFGDPRADRIGIAQRPQIVDLLELAALDVQPSHVGPRGEQRLLEGDLLLVGQLGRPRLRIEPRDARTCQELDPLLIPEGGGTEQGLLAGLLATQVALGALGAVIRRVGLPPDEQDLPLGPFLAQPSRTVGRGEASAHQQVLDLAIRHGREPTTRAGAGPTSEPRWGSGRRSASGARLRSGWDRRRCRCGSYRSADPR